MRSLAAALGIGGRTRFLGAVERTDLPDLYASADAFVLPSTTETQGLVQVEAMAAGCLVIAADAPQNREVVGAEGVLVPADPDAFAGALRDVPDACRAAKGECPARRRALFDPRSGRAHGRTLPEPAPRGGDLHAGLTAPRSPLTRTYVRCRIGQEASMKTHDRERSIPATRAVLGYAADDAGCGVAYARLGRFGRKACSAFRFGSGAIRDWAVERSPMRRCPPWPGACAIAAYRA